MTSAVKKKAVDVLLDVLLCVCAACVISCVVTFIAEGRSLNRMSVFGYRAVFVMSESMEPTIMTHALCVMKVTDDVDVGDVVVYEYEYDDGSTINIIHRIVEESDAGYTTKGDNNDSADDKIVTSEQIVGKVVWYENVTPALFG